MSKDMVFSALWADAVTEYEKQTERKIDKGHAFRKLKSLDDLQKAVEDEEVHFGAFRSDHRRIYSALAKCMSPMQPLLKIVQDSFGNTPYAPAAAVFGAASYLLEACRSVSKAYDGIEELFERMHDITVRLQEYEYGNIESSLQAKMTDILAYFLEVIGKAEACVKRKRFKQWARNVFLRDDGISSSVDRLRRYIESELGLVIALTYGRVKDVQTTASDTLSDIRTMKAGMERDRQRHFSEAEEKILSDSLKTKTTDDIAQHHAANLEKLTKDTGLWIRDDFMFQAWEQEKAPILWVFGKPGVGKTMLAARTIETLQNRYPQHSDIPSLTSVSYLYFKDDNPALQDCAQMWKAAALQITKANDRFKKHVLATIGKKQHDTFASARQIWRQLFLDFFSEDKSLQSPTSLAFLIIDGLDEGPEAERVKFLSCLAELVDRGTNNRKCRIQIAVFARPDIRADPGFEKVGFRTQERIIEVTPDKNTSDIEAFIRQRLGDISVLKVLKKRKANKEYQTLAKQIYKSVQIRSQGMFLWARLVFDQIRESPSSEAIREALQGAPEGLDNMLYHVFKRLEAEEQTHRSYLPDLLSWVLCAYRPLCIAELFVLLLISANQHYYVIEGHLKGRYSSLFEVVGPMVDLEYDEQDAETNANDRASEQDDFDFLDRPDDSDYEEEKKDDMNSSDDEIDEAEQSTKEVFSTNSEDKEDVFDIPAHWFQTTVTFSHARIRDYLTTEGNPSTRRWDDSSIVPKDLNTTRLSVVNTCLQIFLKDITNKYSVNSLETYAKINWIKHLVEIDFNMIPSSSAVHLARLLAMVFHDGRILLKVSEDVWNDFIETWFCTDKYSNLVRKIITEQLHNLDEHQQDWASSVAQSARALFQPFISSCSRKWLTKTGWDDTAYLDKSERIVSMMYAFSRLTDEGTSDGSMDIFNVGSGMTIPLDAIESIANMEPVPKSEHYYAGIAWIMMEANEEDYTERAIEYFKKALELSPGGWMAMEGLARCYGENLHEYETAIHWMEDAIHQLPAAEDYLEFYLQPRIADWKLQLGNNQESVEIAQAAYENSRGFCFGNGTASDGSILRSVKHYIEALYRTERYPQIVELLHELDRTETWKENSSLWAEFLRAQYDSYYNVLVFDKIGKITKVEKNDALQDFMRTSVQNIVDLDSDSIAEDGKIWLAAQAAEWQYHYAPKPEESIALWQKIVTLVDQSNEVIQQSRAWYRTKAAKFLSMMSFSAAILAFTSGSDTSAHIKKLEDLASHKQGSKRYYRASYPALILGLWLHEYAKAEEEVWRACIRPFVKQAIYLLSDEDPWNDQDAYSQLGAALLAAGDIRNASIALGITLKPLEDQRAVRQQPSGNNSSQQDSFSEGELAPTTNILTNDDPKALTGKAADLQIEHPTTAESTSDEPRDTNGKGEGHLGTTDERPIQDESDIGDSSSGTDNDDDESIDPESINPKYAGFGFMWTCDGPCGSEETSYAELYFCRVCENVCFCEKCIDLVRDDKMPFRVCASDHPHVRVFPLIDEAKRLTNALVERKFEIQQQWLEELRSVWGG